MNKVVQELWAKALESEDFPQGRQALNKNNIKFCCLGVLIELAIQEGVAIDKYEDERPGKKGVFRYGYSGQTGYLPGEIIAWAGLNSSDPSVTHNGATAGLSSFNDRGVKFTTLANLIRDQL